MNIPKHPKHHLKHSHGLRPKNIDRHRSKKLLEEPPQGSKKLVGLLEGLEARLRNDRSVKMPNVEGLHGAFDFAGELRRHAEAYKKKPVARSAWDPISQFEHLGLLLTDLAGRVKKASDVELFTLLNSILRSGNSDADMLDEIRERASKGSTKALIEKLSLFEMAAQGMSGDHVLRDITSDIIFNCRFETRMKSLNILRDITMRDDFDYNTADMLRHIWKTPSDEAYWDTYVLKQVLDNALCSKDILPDIRIAVEDSPYQPRWRLDLVLSAFSNPYFSPQAVEQGLIDAISRIADIAQEKRHGIKTDLFFALKGHLSKCRPLDATSVDTLAARVRIVDSQPSLTAVFGAQDGSDAKP